MIKDKDSLRALLKKHKLDAAGEILLPHAIWTYYLHIGDRDKYTQTGNSRVGGLPDLPKSWEWPKNEEGYLNFIMQINMAELEPFEDSPLPATGMLYFFVETDEDGELTQVLYFDGAMEELARAQGFNKNEYLCEDFSNLTPYAVEAYLGLDVPGFGSSLADKVMDAAGDNENGTSIDRFGEFDRALGGITSAEQSVGQLLGYVDRFGGDPREDAVLIKADRTSIAGTGRYETVEEIQESMVEHQKAGRTETVEFCKEMIQDLTWYNENKKWVEAEVQKWRPLWTIESNMKVGLIILDAGCFEIFIADDALQKKNFKNVHVEMTSS